MKKLLLSLCLVGVIAQGAMAASIYQDSVEPGGLSIQAKKSCKVGTSSCNSYFFGIVKKGDCGLQKAMENGNISQVHHVDTAESGWFFNKKITTKVYGE